MCEQQRSFTPGFRRKELHATEKAAAVEGSSPSVAQLGEAATDERVGVFIPDKDGYTHTSRGRVAVLAARRGTVCGFVGRVLRFPQPSIHTHHPLQTSIEHKDTFKFTSRSVDHALPETIVYGLVTMRFWVMLR